MLAKTGKRHRRGVSLLEMLLCVILFSFVVAGTTRLLLVGQAQQALGRDYSVVQINLRTALRRTTRAIRHGLGVVNPSTSANFSASPNSSTSQLIVHVPQATGMSPATIEARYYVQNGTLFVQPSEPEGVAPTPIIGGVQRVIFSYYRTAGSVRTSADSAPNTATDVRMALTAKQGAAVFSADTHVTLRNAFIGF